MSNKCGSKESYLSFFHMFELMFSTSIIFLSARNKTRIPGLRKKALCCFKSYVTAISMSGKMGSGLQNKNLAPQSEHEYSLKEIKMPGWKLSLNTPLMKNLKINYHFCKINLIWRVAQVILRPVESCYLSKLFFTLHTYSMYLLLRWIIEW